MAGFQKGNKAAAGKGRPRRDVTFATPIAAAERRIADRLPELIDNMLHLATGGYERVEEKWLPARLVMTGSGELQSLAFPELPPDALVCVERKVSLADKDRAANIYLIDRILGKPTTRVEASDGDGGPLFKVYVGIDPEQV